MDATTIEIFEKLRQDRKDRADRKREAEKLLHDECLKGSPRYHRCMQFSHQVVALVRDYIPDACMEEAIQALALNAILLDVEIAQVPPDRDVIAKAALDAAALGTGVVRIDPSEFFVHPSDTQK